jgi:glycosyltransferase involved in cell wall biosynthesis
MSRLVSDWRSSGTSDATKFRRTSNRHAQDPRSRRTKLMFLTKYVCRSRLDFLGPVGERYAGLYYSFMERAWANYDFYWHSGMDGVTYEYQPAANELKPVSKNPPRSRRIALLKALLWFCRADHRAPKVVIVSYPYFPNSLMVAILVLLLRPFHLRVIVDVQDLPRETPGTVSQLMWRVIDALNFWHASFIVNSQECAKFYAPRIRGGMVVIPMAANHELFKPEPDIRTKDSVTIAYLGTVAKQRGGFPELVQLIDNLRAEGYALDLVIIGNNADGIDLGSHSWLRVYPSLPVGTFAEILRAAHVGVIPYTDFEYCSLMSMTKMATYMAAGLPVLSTQLTETSNILSKWNCGISVNGWEEMAKALRQLCEDRSLRERLGKNARRAAVEEYNWVKQGETLGEFLGNCLASA